MYLDLSGTEALMKGQNCKIHSGQVNQIPAIYNEYGSRGAYKGQVTVPGGHRMPPTESKGGYFVPARIADNGEGRTGKNNCKR